jgi:hypothetical protein
MNFCWGGPDFKPQTDDGQILQMYLVFNAFYFYSGVGQKDSGVGRAHLPPPPPLATPLLTTGGQYMKFAHAHICHRKMQDYLFLFIIFQVKLLMIHKCTETTYT